MAPVELFLLICYCVFYLASGSPKNVQLTTTNNDYMSLIAGFTAKLQCTVFRCGLERATVQWLKDELIIFNDTEFLASSGLDPGSVILERTASPEYVTKDTCVTEDYVLLLKNLTIQDAGKYRCQLVDFPQQLDFHLDVLGIPKLTWNTHYMLHVTHNSGLKGGFHENFTYDLNECCIEQGISPLCRAMCKPRDMSLTLFDPTSCQNEDYKNFLYCATDGGRHNYIPCCRQRSIPSFCFDFCSFNFKMLKRTHRLCLYYLPEIFACFNSQHSFFPEAPTNLRTKFDRDGMKLCWMHPSSLQNDPAVSFGVHVKEMPQMIMQGDISLIKKSGETIPSQPIPLRNKRASVVLSHESVVNQRVEFNELDPRSIRKSPNGEICISLNTLRKGTRYLAHVEASNEHGASEPSAPLFISTQKNETVFQMLNNHQN